MIIYADEHYRLETGFRSFRYHSSGRTVKVPSLLCLAYFFWPAWILLRVLRLDLSQAFCCGRGFGFFCLGSLYFYDIGEKRWSREKAFQCKRPLKVDLDEKYLFFGDYISNPDRDREIGVYRFDFCEKVLEKIYVYRDIRHVHAVKMVAPGRLAVLCGDYKEEARITFLDLQGRQQFEITGRDQLIRAVDCYCDGDYLVYGTDTQLEQNYLCRYLLVDGRIERLRELEGPVFNIWRQEKDVIGFTVACETGLENVDRISLCTYNLQTGALNRIFEYRIPLKLNKFLQDLFGIPTFEVFHDGSMIIVTNNYYLNIFRKQLTINTSQVH